MALLALGTTMNDRRAPLSSLLLDLERRPNDRRYHVASTAPTRQAVRLVEASPWSGTDDESSLLQGLRAGDESSFVRLMSLHQRSMMRVARMYVSSHATAEDVVQETLLAVLQGIDRFEGRSSLKTWVFRILTNRAKTVGQRERRCEPLAGVEAGDDGPSVPPERFVGRAAGGEWTGHWQQGLPRWASAADDGVVDAEAAGFVRVKIDRLPRMQRLVVVLRDVESWSADEVCQLLDLSETNQRVLLHRARSTVRQHLERFYLDERGHHTE